MNNQEKSVARAGRIRRKIRAVSERPRLSVFKSNRYLSLQLIDDHQGKTVAAVHEKKVAGANRAERLNGLAQEMAQQVTKAGHKEVVFDRGANRYHGVVAALADALRAAGIQF